MSAHDTPEVGSGETACTCPDDDCRETCPVCIVLADDAPCAAQTARQPASPDPVQPADAGEGLSEAERSAIFFEVCPDLAHLMIDGHDQCEAQAERLCDILAAREAAWAEKYAAVMGERDHWKSHAEEAGRGFDRACRDYARVSAARRNAEDRLDAARKYVDDPGNWSALDGRRDDLRAALAIPTATGDE